MTLFLASVRDADEARIAVEGGADGVDIAGAVQPDPSTVRTIVAAARGRPACAACDTGADAAAALATAEMLAAAGVAYVKLGIVPGAGCEARIRALAPLAPAVGLVGVMFADRGVDAALIAVLGQSGFAAAMLDTADGGWLPERLDLPTLASFIEACHGQGLRAGLAGGLEPPDVVRLLALRPDWLGFDAALRRPRGGRIDPRAVAAMRDLIPREPATPGSARVEAAAAALPGSDGATDRIFVHDFVLPMSIGAYAREHGVQQRVRFNVDIDVARLDTVRDDVRDVLSYDVVTDGIRLLAARGHLALVETLAEQVADLVLAQPRAVRATIRVEKLDVGPGSVGVEITRTRAAARPPRGAA